MDEQATFNVFRAKRAGRDAIIVVDSALRPDDESGRFPWLVIVGLDIQNPNDAGLCDQRESDRLSDVEDRLLTALAPESYRYMGRMTWNETRDVFLYVAEPDEFMALLQAQMELKGEAIGEIRVESRHEPQWETYRRFVG
jgi:Family of unknown function (DUF695)